MNTRQKRPASVALLTLLSVVAVLLINMSPAAACSCAPVEPVDVVGGVDVVFTGLVTDGPGDPTRPAWTFEVVGVVKGQVQAEQVVLGEDWGGGCGTNFGRPNNPVVVFANDDGGRLQALGCMPLLSADAFEAQLGAVAPLSGEGVPEVVMSGRVGLSDFALLDGRGRTLARADLGLNGGVVAHCAGTTTVAVVTNWPDYEVNLVDLETMEIIDSRPFSAESLSPYGDRVVCLEGGDLVVASTGNGLDAGAAQLSSSLRHDDGTTEVSKRFEGHSGAVIHPSGTVLLLPSVPGKPLQTLTASDLSTGAGEPVFLTSDVAVIDGDVSRDGATLAMLATVDGLDLRYDTGATHVVTVPLVDGVPSADGVEVVELKLSGVGFADPNGAAQAIWWRDDSSWIVEHETNNAKRIQVVGVDGGVVLPLTTVEWGFGAVPVPTGVLRAANGGVALLGMDGTTVAGEPEPADDFSGRSLSLAPLIDVPDLDLQVIDGSSTVTVTPIADVEIADGPVDLGGATSDSSALWTSPLLWLVVVGASGFGLGLALIGRRARRSDSE